MGNAPERIYEMFSSADLTLPSVRDAEGDEVQLTQGNFVAHFLESRDRDVRRNAFEAMLGAYQSYRNTIATTLGAQVKRDIFFARARRYDSSLQAALEPHNIPVSVYDNLITTVNANLPVLHRYLRLRKKLLGLDDLHMYDLYVPMVKDVEYKVTYADAQDQVARRSRRSAPTTSRRCARASHRAGSMSTRTWASVPARIAGAPMAPIPSCC